jgi:hypothetical protein
MKLDKWQLSGLIAAVIGIAAETTGGGSTLVIACFIAAAVGHISVLFR